MFSRSAIIVCILSAANGVTFWSEEYESQQGPQNYLQRPSNLLRSTAAPEIKFYSEPVQNEAEQNDGDSPLVTPYPIYTQSTKQYAVHEKEVPQKYPLQDYIAKNIPKPSKFIVLDQNYPTESPRPFSLNVPLQRPYTTLNRGRHETNRTNDKISKTTYGKKLTQYKHKAVKHQDPYPALVGTPYPAIKKLPLLLTEAKSIPKYIEGKRILYKYNEEPSRYEEEKHQPYPENNNHNHVPMIRNNYNTQQYQRQQQYQTQTRTPYQIGKYVSYQVPQPPIYPVGSLIPYPFQNEPDTIVPRTVLQRIPYLFQRPQSYEVEENRQEVQNPMQISSFSSVPYPFVLPYNVAVLVPYNAAPDMIRDVQVPKYTRSQPRKATTISPVFNEVSPAVTPSSKQTVARFYDGHFSKYDKQQQHPVDVSEVVEDSGNQEVERRLSDIRSSRKNNRTTQVGRSRSDQRRAQKSEN